MPTTLARIQVSVTPDLSRALAAARATWPGMPESKLVATLACRGAATLPGAGESRSEARAAALNWGVTELAGCYPAGYLEDLRQEWPA